jgi:outer membrane receptor protein involved in Fe transport
MKQIIIFLLFISCQFLAHAQRELPIMLVNGKVLESETSKVMEYCTVSIFDLETKKLVNGTITNELGVFSLTVKKPGKYFLKVSYIGFETLEINNVNVNPKNSTFVTSDIILKSNAKNIQEVEVIGTKTTVRYEMDKKIVDVGKNIAASNGSAVDVLEAAPSIEVDIDGTVKLRGNSNFMVLVNGRPTTLTSSEALQQIPAGNIKNIELITNPSAKYDAGNSAGIINVILKEEKKIGTSGLVRMSVGTFSNYSGSVSLKHNIKKFGFNFSASLRKRSRPNNSTDSLNISFGDVITTTKYRESTRAFGGYRFNYGVDYSIAKNHSVLFDLTFGKRGMNVETAENTYLRNESNFNDRNFLTKSDEDRFSKYFGPSLSYNGMFKNKSTLATYLGFSQRDFKEQVFNSEYDLFDVLNSDSKSTVASLRQNLTARIDYGLPIKKSKLEFGGKVQTTWSDEENNFYDLNLVSNEYELSAFNNSEVVTRKEIYGIYSMFNSEYKSLKYSVGLRAEYEARDLDFRDQSTTYNYYRWNYFPSAALSYKINDRSNIYTSFARKIDRFRGYYLRPTAIKTGANTYFQGNPNLRPRLVNALELGWSNTFKKSTSLSIEAFYKYNTDDFQFISSNFLDSVSIINRPYNIGNSQDIGVETSLSFKPIKWLSADVMGTVSYYSQKGSFNDEVIESESFRWRARFNTYFTVTKTTKIQFSGRYNSKQVNSFTTSSENLDFSLGVRQSFLKRALNLTFNMRNVFYTAKRDSETIYEDYYYSKNTEMIWPQLEIGLSYKINNFKQSRRVTEDGGGDF